MPVLHLRLQARLHFIVPTHRSDFIIVRDIADNPHSLPRESHFHSSFRSWCSSIQQVRGRWTHYIGYPTVKAVLVRYYAVHVRCGSGQMPTGRTLWGWHVGTGKAVAIQTS